MTWFDLIAPVLNNNCQLLLFLLFFFSTPPPPIDWLIPPQPTLFKPAQYTPLFLPQPQYNIIFNSQAIKQGNHEGARIYGQDAIREKNQALNHLRMASRIDACSSRIEGAVRMNQVTDSMKGVVRAMDKGINAMDVDQISKLMDKFETQFEDLDVKTQYSTLYILFGVLCDVFCLF